MVGYAPRGIPSTPAGGSDLPGGDQLANVIAQLTMRQPGYQYASVLPFGMKYDEQGNPISMRPSLVPYLEPLEHLAMSGERQPLSDSSDPMQLATGGMMDQPGEEALLASSLPFGREGDPNVLGAGRGAVRRGSRAAAEEAPPGMGHNMPPEPMEPVAAPKQTKQQQMQLPASEVAANRARMRETLARPAEPFVPDPDASYFERGLIPQAMEGHPGVEQTPLARLQPTPRTDLRPMNTMLTPENRALVRMQVERGLPLGGQTYYPSTFPIRARYGELNTPLSFDDFAWANALTSPQASLPVNIPNASVLLYMKAHGIEPTPENMRAITQPEVEAGAPGYWALSGDRARDWAEYQAEGPPSGFERKQKVASYGRNLAGNYRPSTIDTHETSGLSMGTSNYPYLSTMLPQKQLYGGWENIHRGLAEAMALPPAEAQAGRWFGGGDLTGLKSPQGDYLQTFEDVLRKNAEMRGWDPSYAAMRQRANDVLSGNQVLWQIPGKGPIQYNRALFGKVGTRADGGPLDAGEPAVVGEEGPELFVPDQSGTVIPHDASADDDGDAATESRENQDLWMQMRGTQGYQMRPGAGPGFGAPLDFTSLMALDPGQQAVANAGRRRMIIQALNAAANRGRYGDTMLAHINPREAARAPTYNPTTGLPEFFGADGSDDGAGQGADEGGPGIGHASDPSAGGAAGAAAAGGGDIGGAGGGGQGGGTDFGTAELGQNFATEPHLPGDAATIGAPVGLDKAKQAYENRGFFQRALDFMDPLGMQSMQPTLDDMATWEGGTYHTGWNPGRMIGGLASMAVPGVGGLIAGPVMSRLGGMAYNTAYRDTPVADLGGLIGSGSRAVPGGPFGGGGGTSPSGAPSGAPGPALAGGGAGGGYGGGGGPGAPIGGTPSSLGTALALSGGPAGGPASTMYDQHPSAGLDSGTMPTPAASHRRAPTGGKDRFRLARMGLVMGPYATS